MFGFGPRITPRALSRADFFARTGIFRKSVSNMRMRCETSMLQLHPEGEPEVYLNGNNP
jgi:hypothetical protein